MKVNICMSTYNGERFLAEQLESIQQQTFQDWQLLIRDDGSKDSTCQIIEAFCAKDKRIQFINKGQVENLGVHRSFYELVKADRADFYFFADQDDFWLENKLELFLAQASKEDNTKPVLYYSNHSLVDKHLNILKEKLNYAQVQLSSLLVGNKVPGCVMMINHALAEKWLPEAYKIGMHDSYLITLATVLGKSLYIDKSTIYYRQHENNEIGNRKRSNPLQSFWDMIDTSEQRTRDIIQKYGSLKTEPLQRCEEFVALKSAHFFKRWSIIRKGKYKRDSTLETLEVKILFLTQFGRNKE